MTDLDRTPDHPAWIVRRGTVRDIPEVLALGLAFIREFTPYLRENPTQIVNTLRQMVDDHLLLVLEDGRRIHGMLGAMLVRHPLTGDLVASELFYYVTPGSRRGTGLRLLCSAESEAKALGVTEMHMAALATNPEITALFEARGYHTRDLTYAKEL